MDLADIGRTLAARNTGEELLVEISNALNAGKSPSEATIQKLSQVVDALLSEEDPQMRLNQLQRKLGLLNAEGRPPNSKNKKNREQGERMARDYWWHWLQGCKKGEARGKVAAEFQLSGEFDDRRGFPSPDTVKNNAERYPQQAESAFYYWRILLKPSNEEIRRAVDEIKAHLIKHQVD